MKTLSIPDDEGLLVLVGTPPEAFEQEARLLLALKRFELRRISAGKAAELRGLSKAGCLFKTSQLRMPVVALDDDQLDAEFQHA